MREKGWAVWEKNYSTSRWSTGLNCYILFLFLSQEKWKNWALHRRCPAVCVEQVRKSTCSRVNSLNLVTFSLTSLTSWCVGKDKTLVIAMYLRRDSSSHSRYANNVYPHWHFTAFIFFLLCSIKNTDCRHNLPSFLPDIYFTVLLPRVCAYSFPASNSEKLYLWDFSHPILTFTAHQVSIWKTSHSTRVAYVSLPSITAYIFQAHG